MTRHLSTLLAALLLAGCATMSEDECRSADWYDVGLRDGLDGKPASLLRKHADACAEYGIQPGGPRYQEGRAEGLRRYCRLENAFESGLDGRKYQGVCPPDVDFSFRRYNEAAYEVYQLRRDIDAAHNEIDTMERRLDDKKLSDDKRADLRRDIRELERKLDRLRIDLHNSERRLDRLMAEGHDRPRDR